MRHRPKGTVMQVAHVVRDLDRAMAHWTRTFGAGPFYVADFKLDGQMYRGKPAPFDATIAIGYLGGTNIELVHSNNADPSVFNEVLLTRGEGLHHYWLATEDLEAEMAAYAAAGCPTIAYSEVPGFCDSAMIDTSATLGCFVELQILTPRVWEILEEMQATHAGWDGSDPVRPYPSL